jgi:ATP/ADP translocase
MFAMGNVQGLVGWGLAGLVCDTRQAKRLFPLFGAANVLAAVAGGLGSAPLAAALHAENLLLVWALLLLVALGLGALLARRIPAEAPPDPDRSFVRDVREGLDTVARVRLLTWLLAAAVLFSALYFALNFPFARAAARAYPSPDRLAAFLGVFLASATGVAFAVSLLGANRFFARFGIVRGVLVLPVVYLVGFGTLAARPELTVLAGVRFVQVAWLMGVASPAFHAIFNVVPGERRDQARSLVDGIGTQVGTILGGVVLIVGERTLVDRQLYVAGAVLAARTLGACRGAHRRYGLALLDALRRGQPEVFVADEEPFGGVAHDAAALAVATAACGIPTRASGASRPRSCRAPTAARLATG